MSANDFWFTLFLVYVSCDSIVSTNVPTSWSEQRLDQMEKTMRDLQSKVDHLQSEKSSQDDLIRHLQNRGSQQDTLLAGQSSLLRHLQKHVSVLEEQLRERDVKSRRQQASAQYLNLLHQTGFFHNEKQAAPIPTPDQSSLESQNSNQSFMTSTLHDVSARSDDGGRLQVVVDGLGQEVSKLRADFQTVSSMMDSLQYKDTHTSTFVHWGSSHCTAPSQLVYSGMVGGKLFTHSGSGSNLLCITMSPIMSNHSVSGTAYAYLYGSEYQTGDVETDYDPVCAVCESSFSNVIMIPGTTLCASDWSPLYIGYLMAEQYNYAGGNQFVCVDSARQSVENSGDKHNGANLYFTLAWCGSLPCPPYVNNQIVTCVVCGR